MPLRFVLDTLEESECDAIVYAGTAAALAEGTDPAPGTDIEEERRIFATFGEDEARITYANDLYCTYVIHIPSPVWAGDGGDAGRLAHCYRVCLQLAAEHDCRSIAFPLLGGGRCGFPEEEALRCAAEILGAEEKLDVELLFADQDALDRASVRYPAFA